MRDIKFRGKDVRTGEWRYGDLRTSPNGVIHYIVVKEYENSAYLNDVEYEVEYDAVGQFIGLKDKYGKEIYEGDKVRVEVKCGTFIDEVAFNDGAFFFKNNFGFVGEYGYLLLEVIGNKWEVK